MCNKVQKVGCIFHGDLTISLLKRRIQSKVIISRNVTPSHHIVLAHQALMDWPFPAFPWASPTSLHLILQGCGSLSKMVMLTLLPPTTVLHLLLPLPPTCFSPVPFLLSPILAQLSLPKGSFHNFPRHTFIALGLFLHGISSTYFGMTACQSIYLTKLLAPHGKDHVYLMLHDISRAPHTLSSQKAHSYC